MGDLRERVVSAAAGRDRVADGVKAAALALVVVGHALAWTVLPDGSPAATLDAVPGAFWVTWLLQLLPLFLVMAGVGLARGGPPADSAAVLRRVYRLTSPALPLLLVTMLAAWLVGLVADDSVASAAGIMPVQLVWFLGVYLLVVAVWPVVLRLHRAWHFAALSAAIVIVDLLRANGFTAAGWCNLLLVWSLFAALGANLPRLRTAPPRRLALVLVTTLAAAVILVMVGPYSAALVTTDSLPGLSNLAPPSAVLACFGVAQLMALLLAWPMLDGWLARDAVWVPVALFGARAMGVYLWHMLLMTVAVGAVLATGLTPATMSAAWWLLHGAVLAAVAIAVFLAAPGLLRAADRFAAALATAVPDAARTRLARAPVPVTLALAAVAGIALLLVSESGLADPVSARSVIGIPYVPLVAVAVLAAVVAAARRPTRDRGAVEVG